MTEKFKILYNREMTEAYYSLSQFPWENKKCYAHWLAQTYYFVKNSTRILSLAAGFAKHGEDNIHKRMLAHLKEEDGHEILALKDIESLGFQIDNFPEMLETKNFYENQFFTIQTKGSASLMGWIFFLEGISERFGRTAVNRTRLHGPKCTKFLRVHADEDEGHIESAFALLEKCSSSSYLDIVYNFQNSKRLYTNILLEISSKNSLKNYAENTKTLSMY